MSNKFKNGDVVEHVNHGFIGEVIDYSYALNTYKIRVTEGEVPFGDAEGYWAAEDNLRLLLTVLNRKVISGSNAYTIKVSSGEYVRAGYTRDTAFEYNLISVADELEEAEETEDTDGTENNEDTWTPSVEIEIADGLILRFKEYDDFLDFSKELSNL